MRRLWILIICLLLVIGLAVFRQSLGPLGTSVLQRLKNQKTVVDRLAEFGEPARERLRPAFQKAGVAYPPAAITLVGIKSERVLAIYAGPSAVAMQFIISYPVLGQSGELGPKLREGDRQVPEGLYRVESLNPNSTFYVSLRVNYPNAFDLEMATAEGRSNPGSDIYIHGQTASIGCLAMGDTVIEEIFTLAADTGIENTRVVLSPVDFRNPEVQMDVPQTPGWVSGLYARITAALSALPAP